MPSRFPPHTDPAPGHSYLLSVQVLRGMAALTVAIHHAGYDADTIAVRFGLHPLGLDRFFDLSFGVHVFFVISGFIMVRSARGFGRPGSWRRFLIRRVFRVVPLYWLMTSLVLAGAAIAPSLLNAPLDGWPLVVGSYFFIPIARLNGEIRPVLGQGWTLNYEMFFYVLFAAAMVLPRRFGLLALALALIGLVAVGRSLGPAWPAATVWTDGLLLEFLFGMLIGIGTEAGLRLPAAAAISVALFGVLAAFGFGPITSRFDGLEPWMRGGPPAAAIVAGCVFGPTWPRSAGMLALGALGDASYSLYLTHPFTIRVLRAGWAAGIGDKLPVWLFLLVSCMAAIGVALAVFKWVERPMMRYLRVVETGSPRSKSPVVGTAES